jgi:hypothetical protein
MSRGGLLPSEAEGGKGIGGLYWGRGQKMFRGKVGRFPYPRIPYEFWVCLSGKTDIRRTFFPGMFRLRTEVR